MHGACAYRCDLVFHKVVLLPCLVRGGLVLLEDGRFDLRRLVHLVQALLRQRTHRCGQDGGDEGTTHGASRGLSTALVAILGSCELAQTTRSALSLFCEMPQMQKLVHTLNITCSESC